MSLKSVLHRVAQGCGICLPLLLIASLLVPGCAGKRSDMLSSRIGPKRDDTESPLADEEATDEDASALIAGTNSRTDRSRLSAFTAEEIIEGPPKLGHRVRSWFSRDDDSLTSGDPFLEIEEESGDEDTEETTPDRKAIAGSDRSRYDELLASFEASQGAERPSIDDVKPWWEDSNTTAERNVDHRSRGMRGEELLASFQTTEPGDANTDADTRPWWDAGTPVEPEPSAQQQEPSVASSSSAELPKTTFSRQFDSRLERLRAELQVENESIAATDDASGQTTSERTTENPFQSQDQPRLTIEPSPATSGDEGVAQAEPFAAADEQAHQLPIVVGKGQSVDKQVYPSLMTKPRVSRTDAEPDAARFGGDEGLANDARSRVEALMTEARLDWQAWQLDRAHQLALQAEQLATLENVAFRDGDERPQNLARKIAADLERDTLPTIAEEPVQALAGNPFEATGELGVESAAASFGFDELDRLANPWTAKQAADPTFDPLADPMSSQISPSSEAGTADAIIESHSSGVSLLPPDDDFPSDAEERDWSDADPRDIRLATHKFPEFSMAADKSIRDQMTGLSAEDNQALLQSIADQKSRVLRSTGLHWPELPAGHQSASANERSSGPIRIAEAPRFTLEDDLAIAGAPEANKGAESTGSGRSLLGQFWHSQPIWFIGGLVLLIVALRLWPWPAKDEA